MNKPDSQPVYFIQVTTQEELYKKMYRNGKHCKPLPNQAVCKPCQSWFPEPPTRPQFVPRRPHTTHIRIPGNPIGTKFHVLATVPIQKNVIFYKAQHRIWCTYFFYIYKYHAITSVSNECINKKKYATGRGVVANSVTAVYEKRNDSVSSAK